MKKSIFFLLIIISLFGYISSTFADYTINDLNLNCNSLTNNSIEALYFENQTNAPGQYNYLPIGQTFTFTNQLSGFVDFRLFGPTGNLYFSYNLDCTSQQLPDSCITYPNNTISNTILNQNSDKQALLCENGFFLELSGSLSLLNGGQYDYSCGSLYCILQITDDIIDPQNITGIAQTTYVASGSYNFNIELELSQSGTINDLQSIQIWDAFTITMATSIDNFLHLSVVPTIAPLSIPCGTYTFNIPGGLIQGGDGISANADPILGSIIVNDCPIIDSPSNTGSNNFEYSTGSKIPLVYHDGYGNYFLDVDGLLSMVANILLITFCFISIIVISKYAFNFGQGKNYEKR